jgi:hypothetical protein
MTIRRAGAADLASLARLASLDSACVPELPVLVAESEGRILAAVPFDGGPAVADPFEPTVEILDLLQLRASQIRAARHETGSRPGALRRLRARIA